MKVFEASSSLFVFQQRDYVIMQHADLMSWLYLASLSDLQGAPVLICNREWGGSENDAYSMYVVVTVKPPGVCVPVQCRVPPPGQRWRCPPSLLNDGWPSHPNRSPEPVYTWEAQRANVLFLDKEKLNITEQGPLAFIWGCSQWNSGQKKCFSMHYSLVVLLKLKVLKKS